MKNKENNSILNKFDLTERFTKLIYKYGKLNVAFAVFLLFLIGIGVVGYQYSELIVNKMLNKQYEEHEAGMNRRFQVDNIMLPLLDVLRYKTGADRVMVFEFHNGGENNSGLKFSHFSATYESIDLDNDSIFYVKDQYQQQGTGDFSYIIEDLRREGYIFSPDIDLERNDRLIRKMKHNDVRSYWIYGIFDVDGKPKAILSITSNRANGLDEANINRITPEVIHRISSLLTGINSIY